MSERVERIDLGFRMRPWQQKAYTALHHKRFGVLVIHRRAGKTVFAVTKSIDAALKCELQDPRFGYVAPLFKQAKDIAWPYLKRFALKVPGTQVNEAETWVQFAHNQARIRIYGADNPDSMRGIYLDGVVPDEVAQMKPDAWDEVIFPTLTDRNGWALFIGTPKGINRFSDLYFKAKEKADWGALLMDVYATDVFTPEQIEQIKAEMPPEKFRQEFLCDFTAANEDSLIPLPLCLEAAQRAINVKAYKFAPKVMGIDVARQGADKTVIQCRQGLHADKPIIMAVPDLMEVASRCASIIDEYEPQTVFVDGSGGYGAGVIDRLRNLGYRCIDVQFGGKPNDERFLNKRAEMYWGVKKWLEQGGALPNDSDLIRELSGIQYSHDNARGVMQLESKEDFKERIGASPDRADALALTFAIPVRAGNASKPVQAKVQFDVFSA